MNKIFDLSNEYYEAISPIDFAFSKMKVLDNDSLLENEFNKIKILYDFEHVTKLLFGALHRIKEINPYDYCYNALFTKVNQLDENA